MKRDPIHFFNERGMSVLTEDHLKSELARVQEENRELKRRVASLARRLRASAEQDEATSLNS